MAFVFQKVVDIDETVNKLSLNEIREYKTWLPPKSMSADRIAAKRLRNDSQSSNVEADPAIHRNKKNKFIRKALLCTILLELRIEDLHSSQRPSNK